MPATKKLLVRFEPAEGEPCQGDFLVPRSDEEKIEFFGLKSKRPAEFGVVVYIGREVTDGDVFAKLVDSGTIIPSVEDTLSNLRTYLEKMQGLKIGNVVRLARGRDGFEMEVVSITPSTMPTAFGGRVD